MFHTVTLNPAVDYLLHPALLTAGQTCRSESEELRIGGKGINVSLVLAELEVSSVATGFLGGFTGEWLAQNLRSDRITADFISLPDGITRINVKIKGEEETEINASGPAIPQAQQAALLQKIEALSDGDTLILSGKLSPGCPPDFYGQMLQTVSGKNICAAVDTSGAALLGLLPLRPFLIKPNRQELCELFRKDIRSPEEIKQYARFLQEKGARNVLISLGGDGSFLLDETGKDRFCPVPEGKVLDTVGAGDAMVAGFLAGFETTRDYGEAFLLANACGAATAFSPWLAKRETIDRCLAVLRKFF